MAYDFDTATVQQKSRDDIVRDMIMALNNLDALARGMERKWGHARLPALVPDELCRKFYRQHSKVALATREHRDEDAAVECRRMEAAWRYLDAEAERLGAEPIKPSVWEVALADGTVVAIVRDEDEAAAVDPVERDVQVFMLSEIARLIEAMPTLCKIKEYFPGAKVVTPRVRPPDKFWERGDDLPF